MGESQTRSFVLRGDVCYNRSLTEFDARRDAYVVCVDGVSQGVFDELPDRYQGLPVVDCAGRLVVPGLVDLHVHAPQYTFRGIAMDLELLDWLNTYTFPEESKYADLAYADEAYGYFAQDLRASATTRAAIFASLHVPATALLMDKLEATGLKTYVGKVNMDRNSPDSLTDGSAQASLAATCAWLDQVDGAYRNTRPIITPRFTPSCTDALMEGLGALAGERGLPVQSHLSENLTEIAWVGELCPWAACYGETYDRWGLLGGADKGARKGGADKGGATERGTGPGVTERGASKAIMAHCNYSSPEEVELLRARGTYVAHCPQSNANVASGIAPVRRYLDLGMDVGLGTDVAGGASLSMFRGVTDAVMASKLRWRCVDQSLAPLTIQEAFYLATLGGGSFFGRVGSLAAGYDFDALVLDDSGIRSPRQLGVEQRLERFCYLHGEGGRIEHKYVAGNKVF